MNRAGLGDSVPAAPTASKSDGKCQRGPWKEAEMKCGVWAAFGRRPQHDYHPFPAPLSNTASLPKQWERAENTNLIILWLHWRPVIHKKEDLNLLAFLNTLVFYQMSSTRESSWSYYIDFVDKRRQFIRSDQKTPNKMQSKRINVSIKINWSRVLCKVYKQIISYLLMS